MATTPITFSGLNGFDFNSIINATIQSESGPLQTLQTRQATLTNKDSALSSLGAQISQLETTVTSLASQTSFTNVTANPSDSTVASVSTGSGAVAGTYELNIGNLAKSQVTSSTTGYTDTTAVAADGGSISFTIGGQTTPAIQVTSQTTLSGLADQINSQNTGVFAAVVNDGTNNKLVVTSRKTGQSNGFTINNQLTNSSGTALAFAAGQSASSGNAQNALDANFTVNGLNIKSGSNTVTSAIPGVTVTLLKSGATNVHVAADYSALQNTLSTLVSQYNSLQQFVKDQSATRNGQSGPLANNPLARQIMNDIRSQLMASDNSGQYHYLADIGLQFTRTGTLTFDNSALQTALTSNAGDVQKLFSGSTGNNGLFNNVLAGLQTNDATAGLISTTTTSDKAALKSLSDGIAAQQLRLDMRRNQLTKMYTAADQAMIKLRAASQALSQFGTQSLL
ncbi:MAG TPA: flagellar filament capping protein FliD [Terriglobia bacterium]|nr:flagellar filament capping protein FliD [Terriglobia bacterium]